MMAEQWVKVSWLALLCAAASGCTVWNDVDACERQPGPAQDVNRLSENDQFFTGTNHLIPTTQESWLSVWTSDVNASGDALDKRSEIRVSRLDAEGTPLGTCGEDGEWTPVAATTAPDQVNNAYDPSLSSPRHAGETYPLLIWGVDDGSTTTLMGQELTPGGCDWDNEPPFVVEQVPGVCSSFAGRVRSEDSRCLLPFRLAALDSSSKGGDQYVLLWEDQKGLGAPTLMGRVLDYRDGGNFLPTAANPSGEAGPLFAGSRLPVGFDLIGLDDGHWALAWLETTLSTQSAWVQIWDDRLQPVSKPVQIHQGPPPNSILIDAERVGGDVGVTFVFEDGIYVAVASQKDAHVLAQRELPRPADVNWARMAAAANEDTVALSWTEGKDRVMVQLLSRNLTPKFNDQACDDTPFVVDGGVGTATRQDLAFDAHGGLLVTWTSFEAGGSDRSGAGIRNRYFSPDVLKP